MKTIKLGSGNNKIDVSCMGLGAWAIGGGPAWGGDKDLAQCIDTICACPEMGINIVDTAPGYNFGQSEEIVGKALSKMNRESLVVITKCGIVWEREGSLFNKVGDRQLYKNLTRESVREEIEASLKRLGTDYIDVYMTHWQSVPPFLTPISETMEELNKLKSEGLIKYIGAANVSTEQIKEYVNYGELDIIQAKYSILDRAVETELISVCKENNIILQAFSPLEQGLLSGKLGRDYIPKGAQCNKRWFQPENMQKAMDMMDKWSVFTKKYDCTIPSLAIAWLLAQGDFITVLTGPTTVTHLKENVQAFDIRLSTEDAQEMRKMAEEIDKG